MAQAQGQRHSMSYITERPHGHRKTKNMHTTHAHFAQKHENMHTCSVCSLCTFLHRGCSLCSFLCSFCSLFARHWIKVWKKNSNYVKLKLRKFELWILFSYLQHGSPNLFEKKSSNYVKLELRALELFETDLYVGATSATTLVSTCFCAVTDTDNRLVEGGREQSVIITLDGRDHWCLMATSQTFCLLACATPSPPPKPTNNPMPTLPTDYRYLPNFVKFGFGRQFFARCLGRVHGQLPICLWTQVSCSKTVCVFCIIYSYFFFTILKTFINKTEIAYSSELRRSLVLLALCTDNIRSIKMQKSVPT